MLGGSVYIAFIRLAINLAGVILLFSEISESRYSRKRTIVCYGGFCAVMLIPACIWYVADWESYVRLVAFSLYMCFAFFAIFMSSDSVYLSIYKLALTFYLMAVFLVGGLEIAIVFFNRNVWADIIIRILIILLMTFLIEKKLKRSIRDFSDYVEKEVDRFSVAVMIVSILFGIGYILNPNICVTTPQRLYQIVDKFPCQNLCLLHVDQNDKLFERIESMYKRITVEDLMLSAERYHSYADKNARCVSYVYIVYALVLLP